MPHDEGMAGAPMPAGNRPGPGAPPPPPAPGAAPGAPSPGELAATSEQAHAAQIEAMAAAAPVPSEAFDVKLIGSLVDALNDFMSAVAGDMPDLPTIEWSPPQGEKKWDAPLPPPVFAPLMAIASVVKQAGFGDTHKIDPIGVDSNRALRAITAQIDKAAKDKKLVAAIRGEASPGAGEPIPGAEEAGAPRTRPMDETDEALMGTM